MIDSKDYEWATEAYINTAIVSSLSKTIRDFSEQEVYKLILNCIDLTTLEGSDTIERVSNLCSTALSYLKKSEITTAAICVYPVFASLVKNFVQGTTIKTACVAGGFPSGQLPIHLKVEEVKYAISEGAEEIDMVISRGALLDRNYNQVFDEIAQIKNICNHIHLKVILETGELQSNKNILIASDLAILAGADFIKTSTGKIPISATETAVYLMLTAIKKHYEKTGSIVGIKVAGGISEVEQAKKYVLLTQFVVGNQWMDNRYFRIGASKLANTVYNKILLGS